jgi:hypothetical protein
MATDRPMKRVGVLGTLVWDTIWHPTSGGRPVEQWGGIAYSLSGFAAACPSGWRVVPIVRIGADLADPANSFCTSLPNLHPNARLSVVAEPNDRVELRYHSEAERTERAIGGVSGWSWPELAPLLQDLDALYVNFLSGFELGLGVAERLRTIPIPIYADLHSLFLGPPGAGPRTPRRLPDWQRWVSCFDAIQTNEAELTLLGDDRDSPDAIDPELPAEGPMVLLTTRGAAGATCVDRAPSVAPSAWPHHRGRPLAPSPIRYSVAPATGPVSGDPTGCGDVWGSIAFAALLEGYPVTEAMRRANAVAGARMRLTRIEDLPGAVVSALGRG